MSAHLGLLDRFRKQPPPTDAVKTPVKEHDDGSKTVTTEAGTARPVEDEVVTALDDALGVLSGGNPVMHAMEPSRLLSFENGGPLSVGIVDEATTTRAARPGPPPVTDRRTSA